ncbi:MAG TPA: ABC transporter permease, partial [Polyangiaceae bacterium]|nr:ABC transporter permease [Polyangiaceae bacterium]
MLRLEPRGAPSRAAALGSPILALGLTVLSCAISFAWLGKDPVQGLELFFVAPLSSVRALGELSVKATPLLLMGLGLSLAYRANVCNVGAEGQFILGAICGGGVALQATDHTSGAIVALILLSGALGGALWAALAALARDRWNASEILVSLMLVYVAEELLSYLVQGPWRDPAGYNFPQTATFAAAARIPRLLSGSRANLGAPLALLAAGLFWLVSRRTLTGFRLRVAGLAPAAARYAGFSARTALWTAFLVSGALAGLAGA